MDLPPAIDAQSGPTRLRIPLAVLVVVGAIVGLIALAVVLVIAVPDRPPTYDPGSPEAAVQGFLQAYEEGDIDGAYALLSTRIKADLTLNEYRRVDSEVSWQRDDDRRVVLVRSDVSGDQASVHLRIDQFSGGGLGNTRYSEDRTIRLVREDGAWLIDEPILGFEYVAFGD